MVKLIKTYNFKVTKTHCRLCDKEFEIESMMEWPFLFCSKYCKERWNKLEKEGWPTVSDKEFEMWSNLFKKINKKGVISTQKRPEKKVDQWTRPNKKGSKVGRKRVQESGPTLSL